MNQDFFELMRAQTTQALVAAMRPLIGLCVQLFGTRNNRVATILQDLQVELARQRIALQPPGIHPFVTVVPTVLNPTDRRLLAVPDIADYESHLFQLTNVAPAVKPSSEVIRNDAGEVVGVMPAAITITLTYNAIPNSVAAPANSETPDVAQPAVAEAQEPVADSAPAEQQ